MVRLESFRAELGKRNVAGFFTTPEDLAQKVTAAVAHHLLARNGKAARPAAGDLLKPYLDWIVDCHSTLELRGLRHHGRLSLPLEKVFVALKADRTHPFEQFQARRSLESWRPSSVPESFP